jgi:HK97 family phage prohead protease
MDLEQKQFRTFSFEVKQIDDKDSENFTFEGYASTYDVDRDGERIAKGAFEEGLSEFTPKLHIQHQLQGLDGLPIGSFPVLRVDNIGLYVKADLPREDRRNKDIIIPQIKAKNINSMSIGFMPVEFEFEGDVKVFTKIRIFEISVVSIPANAKALINSHSKAVSPNKNLPIAARDRDWDSDAAVRRIREFTESNEAPNDRYKKFFMYYNQDNADNFGSYKLPFADIIDGEPHVVPKAIFAITGALEGARGGVDIPDADRGRIVSIVNECYRRMAREFDDSSLVSPLEKGKSIEDLANIRDIETTLKDRGFSRKESATLISKIKEFSTQRDAEEKAEKEQRDAAALLEQFQLFKDLNININNFLKQNGKSI